MGIKKELLFSLEKEIICAIAYGSTMCEDFYSESDFDVLLFLRNAELENLFKLREIKLKFADQNINVDFNVHSENDLPKLRKECFWHNNRALYFQKEITLYGLVLIGKNPFTENNNDANEFRKESVRVINSLLYQARKLFINRELTKKEKINLMKWCIYAVLYALSFKGILPKTKKEALQVFGKHYSIEIDPMLFLEAKVNNNVTDDLVQKAYKFLSKLDIIVFEEYGNGRK